MMALIRGRNRAGAMTSPPVADLEIETRIVPAVVEVQNLLALWERLPANRRSLVLKLVKAIVEGEWR
ncbi:hypothetical protein [Roseomonas chloroacetimidivorans]|uniref:hypothetical protein n=1 Tax=Roseomonas chloroacetimidivorans TaxID=1766656 RepID=UPI003C7599DF